MKSGKTIAPFDTTDEIAALVQTLIETERRLEELTAGEVDTIAGRDGRTFFLRRAQDELRLRESAKQAAILNALPANVALLDAQGLIISVNDGWRRFGNTNSIQSTGHGVGLNYLEVCDRARGGNSSEAARVAAGIRAVLGGEEKSFSMEYPCHSPTEQRWFLLTVSPLADDARNGAVVMHVNITERKRGEMASIRLGAVVESSQDAIIGKDLQSVVTSWNQGAEKIFGYAAREIVGTSILRLNPADRPDEHHHILEKIKRGQKVDHFEAVRQTKDGRLIDISVTASPIKGDTGTVVGVSIVARDITQRRRVEEALRISQANMATAQRIAHFGSWELELADTHDVDANTLRWSDEMFRIAGFEPGAVEVTNELFFRLVPEQEHAGIREAVANAIRERRAYSIIHRLIRPDGEECVVQETAQIFFHEKTGLPLKIVGTAHDITERKRAEVALETSEARYRTMLQGIEAGVIVHGADSRVVAFNPKAAELLGVDPAELSDRVATYVQRGRLRADGSPFPDAELPYRRAYASRQPVRDVILGVNRPRNGDLMWLLVNANPLLTPQGEVAEVIVTLMDVTARILAEQAVQRQQTELRVLFDMVPAMIWFKDTENGFLRVNQRVAEATGMPVEAIEGKSAYELFPQQAAGYYADDLEVINSGKPKLAIVEKLRGPDGRELWVHTDKVPVCDKNGKVTGLVALVHDITERKRAEAALETLTRKTELRERMLTTTLSSLKDFAYVYDRQGRFLFANQPLLNLWGLTLDAVVGKNFLELGYPPDLAARLQREVEEVFETKKNVSGETLYTSPSGHPGVYEYIFSPAITADGTVDFVVGSTRDITERKRNEQSLRESEEHFRFLNDLNDATRELADPTQIMAVASRMLGEHLRVSRCAYADVEKDGERFTILHDYTDGCASTVGEYQLSLFGAGAVANLRSGQTLIVNNVDAELLPEEGADMFNAIGIKAIISCPLLKDGELRAIMAIHQASPREWKPSEIVLVREVVGRCWATIERRTAEENLRISEKRFKALFDQAAVGVAVSDVATGRFLQVNGQFCEIVGRSPEELEHLRFSDITHPHDVAGSLEAARRLVAGTIRESIQEKRYLRNDGSEVWATVTVAPMWAPGETADTFIAVIQDISERKVLEEQFRQAQKMEAIGTLAGGIAHDFNNILAVIYGYTELARMELKDNPSIRDHLAAVSQASVRATDLVRQILTFSRQQTQERALIQLRPVVAETLKMLRATIPSTIEFESSLATDAPVVLADASQIHQLIMNLGTNAWHAMKEHPGRLRVTLEKCVVDAAHAATQSRLHAGVYARVSVSDTGCGMDAATVRRIFDPFFTTKAPGEGTGLGLAVVHGIMDSHDGAVTVYSQPGEGTVFHLYFPAHAGEASVPLAELGPVPSGQGERVLFVDDEEWLVRLAEKSLVTLGYEVETATRPDVALAMVRKDPERFALVLTDLTMPGMTGLTLASQLLAIRPDLPIILMTGYSATLTSERVEAAGLRQLLHKPTTLHSLGTAVHSALFPPPQH